MNSNRDVFEIQTGERVLIYGVGNVGRGDDGLGVRLVEKLEERLDDRVGESLVRFESNYQLNVEDALMISEYNVVIFVDASVDPSARAPFDIARVRAQESAVFSTHAMDMGGVLLTCQRLYHKFPRAYVLTLPGYEWGVNEQLSLGAGKNLEKALDFLEGTIRCIEGKM